MTTILRIKGAGEQQDIATRDLPLAIGHSDDGSITFGDNAELRAVAYLGEVDGQVFVQPESGPRSIRLNGIVIDGSAWLTAGDMIKIGRKFIEVSSDAGVLALSSVEEENAGKAEDAAGFTVERLESEESSVEPRIIPVGPIGPPRGGRNNSKGFIALLILFAGLLIGVAFVLAASPARVSVTPKPDSISLSGVPPPIPFAGRYLVLPGNYLVEAEKFGYRKLEQQITVEFGSEPEFNYQLQKLPGYLDVISRPVESAEVMIDDKVIGYTPLRSLELEAGQHELRVIADRYIPFTKTIEVRGMGDRQITEITLLPGWGTLEISTEPSGAKVWLDGTELGFTPLRANPMAGTYRLELRKSGWMSVSRDITINANETVMLPLVQLEKVDGTLDLTTSPAGASVMVNGEPRGKSPITLTLKSGRNYKITVSKAGFETVSRKINLDDDNTKSLTIDLTPKYGIIFLNVRPAGAKLKIDGELLGSASRRLRLTTTPHRLEIFKPGYVTHAMTFTPRLGVSKKFDVELEKIDKSLPDKIDSEIKTAVGQIFRLIQLKKPAQFEMGASRREAGRRSNEVQYLVELTRSFYISEKEVTNKEFQLFDDQHNSGIEQGIDLSEPDQPVVSVGWDDAARYMNWLSEKDGLPPAYREKNGIMVAVDPIATGYRLPTESEWAFAARYEGGRRPTDDPLKFPWGSGMPPLDNRGNYADETAAGMLPIIIREYSDGYLFAAPVGQFPANKAKIYDLGGNVAEWTHDYYDVYTGRGDQVLRDPTGPKTGDLHVVRGASWRHGSITELRLSYRDYALKPRNDLGFRIVRYATKSSN